MNFIQDVKDQLQKSGELPFEEMALALFRFQATQNPLYASYLKHLRVKIDDIRTLAQIPFLPISFFKHHAVKTGHFIPETTFLSSGTTQQNRSQHQVADLGFYLQHTVRIFTRFYGSLRQYVFIALLPSYQEQGQSSLIRMVEHFMRESGQEELYFFRQNGSGIYQALQRAREAKRQVMLIGVTYALLDLAAELTEGEREMYSDVIVMETGGMKGRREELVRAAVHTELQAAFGISAVHSEYGMTELLSQAYSQGQGIFRSPPAMRILFRDPNDPLSGEEGRASGGINVIDLANVQTCAFIETQDLGRRHPDGSFEILGRFDNSDLRGCSLLMGGQG
ncbi:acyltransferase [soil metagenome]